MKSRIITDKLSIAVLEGRLKACNNLSGHNIFLDPDSKLKND